MLGSILHEPMKEAVMTKQVAFDERLDAVLMRMSSRSRSVAAMRPFRAGRTYIVRCG
jgi:hypothetical protein